MKMTHTLTGAQIVMECLKEQGVDTVFGYPGGAALFIYDALYQNSDKIKHYLTAHEQGAAHAADGYARATGKVGVCFATSGPGATNLVTGIATAYMDSIPMVAITSNVVSSLLGKDSFQEADIAGITMPITKHNYIVKDGTMLADTIRDAFEIAQSGRKGPVLVDIPKDITANEYDFEPAKEKKVVKSTPIREVDLIAATELIGNCNKPVIFAGGGIISSDATNELVAFAEKIDAPVSCSLMGLGGFPVSNELFTGMLGMHGSKPSNLATTHCDLFIAIGSRFSDRVISDAKRFADKAKIIHIDIDPAEIDKNIRADVSVIGNVKEILELLNKKIEKKQNIEWHEKIQEYKRKFPLDYVHDGKLHPQYIMQRIAEITKSEAIIVTEVGQHQIWAAQHYSYQYPRTFISSGGFGTMGFGLGAAIGAKLGMPDKRVIHIAGDGSFRMNNIELATLTNYQVPIITIIMNNGTLGMVRQWQKLFYEERYSQTTLQGRGPDFNMLADAYGIENYVATSMDEFEEVFAKALKSEKAVLINCAIDIDERVLPMVPGGKPISEMIVD